MSDPFVGEIRMFGGSFAPAGWAFCNGALMPISENDVLFTLIGTTYGGDGQSTFGLPDLMSRFPIHAGQGPGLSNRQLGEMAGTESVTLNVNQIPSHSHGAQVASGPGSQASPQGGLWASSDLNLYGTAAPTVAMNAQTLPAAGGNQPHENMMPYLVVSFILSLYGIFPSQN